MRRAIKLDEKDNVATAISTITSGETIELDGTTIDIQEDVPLGYKIALKAFQKDESVYKYGEVIGVTTEAIEQGAIVHVHNVKSIRGITTKEQAQ